GRAAQRRPGALALPRPERALAAGGPLRRLAAQGSTPAAAARGGRRSVSRRAGGHARGADASPELDDYLPLQTGSRFSAKAVAPSRASSETMTGPAISPCFCQASSRLQSCCSWRICLEAISESGPFLAIASA